MPDGLVFKVLIPIVASPVGAFIIGLVVMKTIYIVFANAHPARVGRFFRSMQIASAATMAGMHGSNDAQKSMGIITLAWASYQISKLKAQGMTIPESLEKPEVHWSVMLACAIAMAFGTAAGGWRIIKTMGHKIIKLEPVHGFAAETSSSVIILLADLVKAPISTTHAISGSIFGVGAAKRFSAVKWEVAERMVVAWILTLPASGGVAAISYLIFRGLGIE
jgi:PiT family inorganic phosphate transporter